MKSPPRPRKRRLRPASRAPLVLAAPINRWDEAIPLGNGLLGGLLWGGARGLKLSLDRGDLWDLRLPEVFFREDWTWATIRRLVAERKQEEIVELCDRPYSDLPYPTKIPAGRIELTPPRGADVASFELDLGRAAGADGRPAAEVFFSAAAPVAMLRVPVGTRWRIIPPRYAAEPEKDAPAGISVGELARLGYPAPRRGKAGGTAWFFQQGAEGFAYAVAVGARDRRDRTELAVAIACTNDGPDPVAAARGRVAAALDAGYDATLRPHARWWKRFWARSRVEVPDPAVQAHYDLVQYFYGAASRRGAPPIPLQGVWTADEGRLPPWKGDYHHDLNTQLTYWAYLAADHLDEGLSFLDFMWGLLPEHREFARRFYGTPGACVPGVMSLDGKQMGGWAMYSLSPTNGAWVAQAFYGHWRYTMDPAFLHERAYPYAEAIGRCLAAMLAPGGNGKLKLPLSSSPEVHDNRLDAWLKPNSNYDLSLLRWLFAALAEMADALSLASEASHWRSLLGRMDDLAIHPATAWGGPAAPGEGVLAISSDEALTESHRHFSHLMPIYPLGTLHVEGSDTDRAVIRESLMQLDRLGPGYWCGYSYAWLACMAARAGEPERAATMLGLYLRGFISRNGFHLNGDYRNQGLSLFKYRPFTLEGNFAAAQAVHEMLLQSWGGAVRVFPAVPEAWRDVRFADLRAEGAFRVSAERAEGQTRYVRVVAERGGRLRLRDPFQGTQPAWSRRGAKRVGRDFEIELAAGEAIEAAAPR